VKTIGDKLIPTQLSVFQLTQRIILKSQAGLEIALKEVHFVHFGSSAWTQKNIK